LFESLKIELFWCALARFMCVAPDRSKKCTKLNNASSRGRHQEKRMDFADQPVLRDKLKKWKLF